VNKDFHSPSLAAYRDKTLAGATESPTKRLGSGVQEAEQFCLFDDQRCL